LVELTILCQLVSTQKIDGHLNIIPMMLR